MLFSESTWPELYQSAVDAFPHTTRRQYAIDPITISELRIVPFLGFRTLFLRTRALNEDREYRPMIVVKNVQYREHRGPGVVELRASDGESYLLEPPALEDHDLILRCNCPDFYWRFNYFDHLDRSLFGRVRRKYEAKANPGSANPQEMPGVCKHLMKMAQVLTGTIFS